MILSLSDWRTWLWAFFAFWAGAIPFAVWLTSLRGADVRSVGDRNPGATNAFKAAGAVNGLLVLLLDTSKAVIPVLLARHIFLFDGPGMVVIATAPLLGHAYSPFLHFKGGKAVAAALGVWIGLTYWQVPVVAVTALLLWFALLRRSGWAVILTLITIAAFLMIFRPDPLLLQVLAFQIILLVWKHRFELRIA